MKLCMTTAVKKDNMVIFNSDNLATTLEERKKISTPWWAVVAGAFFIEDKIVLVKRSSDVNYPNCWTLIPTGVSDTLEELCHPGIGLKREAREELLLFQNGKRIKPVPELLSKDRIFIHNEASGENFSDIGNLCLIDPLLIFIQVYKLNLKLEGLVIRDGEEHNGKPLDREIKLVSLDEICSVEPVAASLKWLQENIAKVKEMVRRS